MTPQQMCCRSLVAAVGTFALLQSIRYYRSKYRSGMIPRSNGQRVVVCKLMQLLPVTLCRSTTNTSSTLRRRYYVGRRSLHSCSQSTKCCDFYCALARPQVAKKGGDLSRGWE